MTKENKQIILIVEDDEIILRALYLTFHKADYTIVTVNDGEEALRVTERIKPDLVLLDLLIPKMSGLDYLKNLRSNPVLKSTKVIVLSNLDDDESVARAKALGVKTFLVKSNIKLATLAEKVKEILSK